MIESRRHHAYNLNRLSVELNRASDDVWVAAKAARPKSISQDNDVVSARLELFRFEETAMCRGHSQQRKEIGGCSEAEQTFRCLPLFGEITAGKVIRRHLFKNRVLVVLVEKVCC